MARDLNLKVLLQAVDRATGPLRKITQGSSGTAKALKASRDELKQFERAQRDISGYRRLQGSLSKTSSDLDAAQERVRKLRAQMREGGGQTAKFQREFTKANEAVAKLTRGVQEQRRRLGPQAQKLREAGINTARLNEEEQRLARSMETANQRIRRQQTLLKRLGEANVAGRFSTMTSEVGRFGRRAALTGTLAVGSIFGIANSTASLGDEVAKTADKVGVGITQLQEMRYAAERSGVSTQKLDSSLERFVKRIGEAEQGTGAAKKAYEELGLSASQLAQMTPEAALGVVADRLKDVDSQTQRVAIAAQLFGREGVAMVNMMKDGSAGLQQLYADGRATGYVLGEQAARDAEKFKDALLDAQLGMAGMKNTIGAALMPAITDMMKDLSGWMRENRDRVKAFAQEFGTRLKAAVPVIANMARGFASAAGTVASVTSALASLVGGFDNLGMIIGTIFAGKAILSVVAFGGALVKVGTALFSLTGALPAVAAGVKAIGVALMANPIGLIIAGIAGVALLIWKYWEPIKAFMGKLWSGVTAVISRAWEWMKSLFSWTPLGMIIENWGSITEWFKGLGDGIMKVLGKALGWITDKFLAPVRAIKDTLGAAWNALFGGSDEADAKIKKATRTARKAAGAAAIGAGVAAGGPAMADVPIDQRPPISASAPAAQGGGNTYQITVNAGPGMDEQELARQVQRLIAQHEREKAARQRSSLYDQE